MTVTIQIGNSDDKLSQADWSRYVAAVASHIEYYAEDNGLTIHFFASSEGTQRWQNAAWVLGAYPEVAAQLKARLAGVRAQYQQDSVAWTEGETQFI